MCASRRGPEWLIADTLAGAMNIDTMGFARDVTAMYEHSGCEHSGRISMHSGSGSAVSKEDRCDCDVSVYPFLCPSFFFLFRYDRSIYICMST